MAVNQLSIETFQPVIVDYQRRPDGRTVWGCMDERPPHVSDKVLAGFHYYQTPGGLYGIALDTAVAMEMRKKGRFTNKNQPVYRLAAAIYDELEGSDMLAFLHEICAAEGSAQKIAESTADSGQNQAVYASAQAFNPDVTPAQFEEAAEITDYLRANRYIDEAGVVYNSLRHGSAGHTSIPSAHLKRVDHNALSYIALWRPDKCFDVPEADARSIRAYVVGMGALEYVYRVLKDPYPLYLTDALAVTATRAATIQTHYLLGPDGQPLPILSDLEKAA